uniref:NADH-ubiquinone oxidoreductase chain 4 n=1 Tax=Tinaminyssus melloi TaxID=105222 RepID=A0A5Q0RZ33_9ACAR|nr:NADH dehydrogenase subunit 4 [Tinaminyssus melloi]QGA47513.1 NADH dehydrogenase subunit 4 [Tinaminyssus melloi]
MLSLFSLFMMMMLLFMSMNMFISGVIFMDSLSIIMVLMSIMMMILIILVIDKYMYMGYYMMVAMSVLLFMICLVFTSVNILMFYIFFEAVLVPMYFVILYWGNNVERYSSAMYMIMYTLVGSIPLLLFLCVKTHFMSLSFVLSTISFFSELTFLEMMALLLAFLVKIPMYMLHGWLPKAHVEAPVVGSMLLAGILLKLGGYGLFRILMMCDNVSVSNVMMMLSMVSMFGALYVGYCCVFMVDVKQLIAYSSVVHMSMIIIVLLMGYEWSITGSFMMMVAHGFCSSCLFFMANCMYERYYTRNILMLKGCMGLFSGLSFFWFIFNVMNMGAPPFLGFMSELVMMGCLVKYSYLYMILLFMYVLFSSAYTMYLYSYVQHGKVWFLQAVNLASLREYDVCFMHLLFVVVFLLKLSVFI